MYTNGWRVYIGDYAYIYDAKQNGWHVATSETFKTYGLVQPEIDGIPVKSMGYRPWGGGPCYGTFHYCKNLVSLPDDFVIPNTVTSVERLFWGCSNLISIPENFVIPETVKNAKELFLGCKSLKMIPKSFRVPDNCNAKGLFEECDNIECVPPQFRDEKYF